MRTQPGSKAPEGMSTASTMPDIPEEPEPRVDLDYVLVHEVGQLGKFQVLTMLLVSVPMAMSAFMSEYIFGAAAIPHRCRITECGEDSQLFENFSPDWLLNAIPASFVGTTGVASCFRFRAIGNGTLDNCPANLFDKNEIDDCDDFVYARYDSIVYEFDMACQELRRGLIGIANSIGYVVVLPVVGYISDRFGRRVALIISVLNMALFGLIRAFSVSYTMYLTLQFCQTAFGAGIYSSAFIIATELVGPDWRVLSAATSSALFSLGHVVLGIVAWVVDYWRTLLLVINIPCFIIIAYFWVLPESVRWLLSKNKFEEAKVALEQISRVNKRQISQKSMAALLTPASVPESDTIRSKCSPIKIILNSRILLRRCLTIPIWWMTTMFIFYGHTLMAVNLSEQRYLNYILTVAIEVPGFFSSVLLLDKIGRKPTLSIGFGMCAVCNMSFAFIPPGNVVLRTATFLVAKFGIALVYTSLYLYTSELYPTQYRNSFIAYSAMAGWIGGILAPMTPVMAYYWGGFPSMLFGCLALLSAFLVLTQPETLGAKIPDTLAEAEALGRS